MSRGLTTAADSSPAATPSFGSYGGTAPENYERYFVPAIGAPLAAELADFAALRLGERVLDVACGTGVVAKLAAGRVGATGSVAGVDLNPGMLAVARATTPAHMAIAWHQGSAEALPLADGSADVALCQLGLQFFPDRRAAVGETLRVLSPGGRLAVNVPGPTPPLFAVMEAALAAHLSPEVAAFVGQVFSLHEPREIEELLSSAGLHDVELRSSIQRLPLPAPAEFLWQYLHSTPLAAAVAQLDDAPRDALARDVLTAWQPMTVDGALVLELPVVLARGRAH